MVGYTYTSINRMLEYLLTVQVMKWKQTHDAKGSNYMKQWYEKGCHSGLKCLYDIQDLSPPGKIITRSNSRH